VFVALGVVALGVEMLSSVVLPALPHSATGAELVPRLPRLTSAQPRVVARF